METTISERGFRICLVFLVGLLPFICQTIMSTQTSASIATTTAVPTYEPSPTPRLLVPFHVDFDPDRWKWSIEDGTLLLAHCQIPHCTIGLTQGRGLPPDWSVEHNRKTLGQEEYDVTKVSHQGQLQYVTYCNTWGVYNCFKVSVRDGAESCIQDAELVLSTYHHSDYQRKP